jgi:hypothetical protein
LIAYSLETETKRSPHSGDVMPSTDGPFIRREARRVFDRFFVSSVFFRSGSGNSS